MGSALYAHVFLVVMKESNDYIRLVKEGHNQMSLTQHLIRRIYIYIYI